MFSRLGEERSMEAVGALKQLKNGIERQAALLAFVEVRHPSPAGREVQEHFEFAHTDPYSELISRLADQPELAVALARELLRGPQLATLLGQLASREAQRDPQHALSIGAGLAGKDRTQFLQRVAQSWARTDGDAAWAWALQERDPALRESVQLAVLGGLDPQAASQRLELLSGSARDQGLRSVAMQWAQSDTKAAIDWINSLPDPQERETALASVREVAPVGIGAHLATGKEGYPVIQEIVGGGALSDSPQVAKGSHIAAIRDGTGNIIDLKGKELTEAVSLLRGAPGSSVTMEVIPPGGSLADRKVVVLTRRQLLFKQNPFGQAR
jgi:hypothetical protein